MASSINYGSAKLTWISHSCFMLEAHGKRVYFDPYNLPENSPEADAVFVSHEHYDHCDASMISRVCKKDTKVICPQKASLKLQALSGRLQVIREGDAPAVYGFYSKVVHAYNLNKPFHPKGVGVGYVVTVDGKQFYHAGDTDFTPEMTVLKNIDVAMLPVGGTYTMTVDEAAQAANAFKPKVLIPMHYRSLEGLATDASALLEKVGKETKVDLLDPLH